MTPVPPGPSLAGAPFDTAWARAVRDAPPADRAAWLAAADAARAGNPSLHVGAMEVYRALAADAPLDDPDWIARILFLFARENRRDAAIDAIAGRCSTSPDPDLARTSLLVAAECALDRADVATTERALLALLAAERGRGTAFERRLCGSLAETYRRLTRDFEVLLLARRALAIVVPGTLPRQTAAMWYRVADALGGLGEWPAFRDALDEMERVLAALPPDTEIPLRRRLTVQRIRHAARTGDLAAAERAVADLERLVALPAPEPADPRWFDMIRASIAVQTGRLDDGRRLLDAVRARPAARAGVDPLPQYELEYALAARQFDEARDVARRMLDVVETRGEAFGTGSALLWASRAVEVATVHAPDPVLARRAFDAAGRTILRRIEEVEHVMRLLPELSTSEPEDRAFLIASRARFQQEQARLLDGVAEFFRTHLDAVADLLPRFDASDAFVSVCAWCRRVAVADGTWLPVGHYLPRQGPLRLTHGICPECLHREQAHLPRRGPAPS
ncbi:MAG: hypothetical protein JNM10_06880 [Planctomycetia bacterium]|nr:hypothetical protein [Planctomycetia bacterium]